MVCRVNGVLRRPVIGLVSSSWSLLWSSAGVDTRAATHDRTSNCDERCRLITMSTWSVASHWSVSGQCVQLQVLMSSRVFLVSRARGQWLGRDALSFALKFIAIKRSSYARQFYACI